MEIEILTKNEVILLNNPPVLSHQQKEYYFNISGDLLEYLQINYKKENIAYFILLYGYFRISNKFCIINDDCVKDLEYIHNRYNLSASQIKIPERTIRMYKAKIKQHLCINRYTDEIKATLLDEATALANNFTHRKRIFYSLIELSIKLKIEVPSYTEISRIITLAINSQKRDILEKLTPFLKDEKLNLLDEFLEKDEEYQNRWNLTRYKILEHSTKKNQMALSLSKFNAIK